MGYKKKTGIMTVRVKSYTPLWIDAAESKTGRLITLFLRNKPADKFKAYLDSMIASNAFVAVFAAKMPDADMYKFNGFAKYAFFGQRARARRTIAEADLARTLDEDYNLVKSVKGESMATGGSGRVDRRNTGTKMTRALGFAVDNSAAWSAERGKREIAKAARERKALLVRLRRRYFEDRAFFVGSNTLTEAQWDEYCLSRHYAKEGVPHPQTSTNVDYVDALNAEERDDFENKLREAGLL